MRLENLITRENSWLYINIVAIYLVFLHLPKNFNDSPVFLIVTFGLFILVFKISSLETFHHVLFKKLLATLEMELRKIGPKYDFYNLKKEAQEEINRIDKYFHDHAASFSSLLIASMMQVPPFLFQFIEIIPPKIFTVQTLTIYSYYITVIIIAINILIMYDDFRQIKNYMFVNYRQVYKKYGAKDGK